MIRASFLLTCALLLPLSLVADEPPDAAASDPSVEQPTPTTTGEPASEDPAPEEPAPDPATSEEAEPDPCKSRPPSRDFWLDNFRSGLHRSACLTSHWFDGFFGDERYESELEQNYGRLTAGVAWDEDDNVDLDLHLDAQLYLPRAEKRWRAFINRDDEDDFAANRGREELTRLPDFFDSARDEEWLLGLGYRPAKRKDRALDVDAGVKLDFPVDPFVRVRARRRWFLNESRLVRVRNTLFWRNQKGYGLTHNTDVEQVLTPNLLLRWANYGTWSESTRGVDWLTAVTLYQNLDGERALAYQASIRGETDVPVNVGRYTVRTIYRQRWLREWLFVESYVGMTWPRDPGEVRRESLQFGISFEMRYGDFRK